jgi:outer membrane protein TolC
VNWHLRHGFALSSTLYKYLSLAFAIHVLTQESALAATEKLSFPKATEIYESTGYQAQILDSKIKEADGDLGTARSYYYPQIDLEVNNAFPRTRGAITARQALYEAGAIDARIDAAKAKKDTAFFTKKNFKLEGFAEFADQYFKVLELQRKKSLYETKYLPTYFAIANKIDQGWQHQLMPIEVKSMADIEQNNQEVLSQALDIQLETEKLKLGQMLNLEPDAIVLEETPTESLIVEKKFPLKNVLTRASAEHPKIRLGEFKKAAVDAERRAVMAPELPRLFATAVYTLTTTGKGDGSKLFGVGLTLNVPLFHGLVSFDKRKKYAEQMVQADLEYRSSRYLILRQINSLVRQHELALGSVKALSSNIKVMNREWSRAQSDFKIGNPAVLGTLFGRLTALRTAEENLVAQRLLANKTGLVLERIQSELKE